ncbi:hypothetical protein MNV49_003344 [Pseudohyphozyma bogoriensis]|nr:hypothetical protein MNV49_003344 [Pseudohyphozyma bogoriensis]
MQEEHAVQQPNSYALESSEDESDWGDDAPRRPTPARRTPVVSYEGAALPTGAEVVFLVGAAGEVAAKYIGVEGEAIKVVLDGTQVGEIYTIESTTLVFLTSDLVLASLHPLASSLLTSLKPSSTSIIAPFYLPNYLPPTPAKLFSIGDAPSSISHLVTPYAPPNLLHGLAASLLTNSSLLSTSTSSFLLLVPSITAPPPLNGPFSTSTLAEPLGGVWGEVRVSFGAVAQALGWSWWSGKEVKGKGFQWAVKERKERRREEIGSMYM